jgi:hypothetical protein
MDLQSFKDWCASERLLTQKDIAAALGVSAQTIKNWEVRGEVPYWVRFSTHAITCRLTPLVVTVANFKAWQQRNNLSTNEATGVALGRKRQSVHQWYSRSSFPNWLALACVGYEHLNKTALNDARPDQPR